MSGKRKSSPLPNHAGRRQHRAAVVSPTVSRMLTALKERWQSLAVAERALAVQALLQSGCSTRGLAVDLSVSEGTVRWYGRIAALPVEKLSCVQSGQSAKQVLASMAEGQPAPRVSAVRTLYRWLTRLLPVVYAVQYADELQRRVSCSPKRRRGRPQRLESLQPRAKLPGYMPDRIEYLLGWSLRWLIANFDCEQRLTLTASLARMLSAAPEESLVRNTL